MNSVLRVSQGFSETTGGCRKRSLISVTDSGGRTDYGVKLGLLSSYASSGELCFYLSKPDLDISRPERREFDN